MESLTHPSFSYTLDFHKEPSKHDEIQSLYRNGHSCSPITVVINDVWIFSSLFAQV